MVKLNENGNDFEIEFPHKGEFNLEDIKVLAIDITDYSKRYDLLSENTMTGTKIKGNVITGNIDADSDEWLFFSIPYSDGWTCSVDGIDTTIKRADYAFMAIRISKGEHNISLHYNSPMHNEGMALSVIGGIILLIILIFQRLKIVCC